MKKIFLFFLLGVALIFIILLRNQDKKINSKVVFINQIRGEECCQKGSYETTKKQLDLFKEKNIPVTFVLRYDVLNNKKFVSLLKSYRSNKFEYGLFLEITPQLAADAGVAYKGTEERWYRAQYAYLVGYLQEERIKIIDTAMAAFKVQFGYVPKTTGGWMIDTYSAAYLSSRYGVTAHEITREQWGTDGYVLYGGSILPAYIPSKNWVFMPAHSQDDSLPFKIIRQTLIDPVRNYGDLTSGYTSQPNDYRRTKGFGYFKHLLYQTQFSTVPVAILGLENSLEKKYQDIYFDQVAYVEKNIGRSNVIFPSQVQITAQPNFTLGSDYLNKSYKAFWVETKGYRARIVIQGQSLYLSDLRIFDPSLTDPFTVSATGDKTAFWEIPYVFDSSKKGLPKDTTALTRKIGALFSYFGNSDWLREQLNPVLNEKFIQEINGLAFPHKKEGFDLSINRRNEGVVLTYEREDGGVVELQFNDDAFEVRGVTAGEVHMYGAVGENTELTKKEVQGGILYTPRFLGVQEKNDVREEPTSRLTRVSEAQISLIYNAPLSLIGRNPVRLVVVSKDAGGMPVRLKKMTITYEGGNFDSVKIFETEGHLGEFDGMYYVDIEQKKAGLYSPILTYNEKEMRLQPVSFVFDCKQNITVCLASPQKLVDYMKVKVGDILNRR